MHGTFIISGEPAGANGAHGMGQRLIKRQPTKHIDSRGNKGKQQIDFKQHLGHIPQAGQHPFLCGTGGFRIVHQDGTLSRLRQQGDKNHDNPQAAEPMRHHAPKENAGGQPCQAVKNRGPGAGKARNTFEHRIQGI